MVTRSVKKNRLLWPSDHAWSAQRGSYFRCRPVRQYFRWTKTLPLFALSSPTGFCWRSLRCQFAQTKKAHGRRRGMKLQPCGCLYYTRSSCTRWWLQDVGIRKGKPLRRSATTRDYCPRACVRACVPVCVATALSLSLSFS
jgi:hypothetical protein